MLWIVVVVLIFFIVYPYIVYPVILKLLPKRTATTKSIKSSSADRESVTLFIAAYNEEKVIADKLENSLKLNASGMNFEIVVGSDGSTDATNHIVRKYEEKYPNIRLLNFKERQGKVNVLNRGIPLCKGEIILLSDANAMYNEKCLECIMPHFKDADVGCVAGEKRMIRADGAISQNEGLYWKLESKIKQRESQVETVIGADGACYAIRKRNFRQLPSQTAVDDFLLSMKIVEQGYRIEYEPNAFSIEEAGVTMQQEWKRKTRIAAGNYFNLQFLTSFFKPSIVSFMFLSHKVLRWISPFIFILLTFCLGWLAKYDRLAMEIFILLITSYLIAYMKYKNVENILTNNRLSNLFSYFYLTVLSQFVGFCHWLTGVQSAMWNTIRN